MRLLELGAIAMVYDQPPSELMASQPDEAFEKASEYHATPFGRAIFDCALEHMGFSLRKPEPAV
jgi:hypothetical protein